jgi:hypothetical protein
MMKREVLSASQAPVAFLTGDLNDIFMMSGGRAGGRIFASNVVMLIKHRACGLGKGELEEGRLSHTKFLMERTMFDPGCCFEKSGPNGRLGTAEGLTSTSLQDFGLESFLYPARNICIHVTS